MRVKLKYICVRILSFPREEWYTFWKNKIIPYNIWKTKYKGLELISPKTKTKKSRNKSAPKLNPPDTLVKVGGPDLPWAEVGSYCRLKQHHRIRCRRHHRCRWRAQKPVIKTDQIQGPKPKLGSPDLGLLNPKMIGRGEISLPKGRVSTDSQPWGRRRDETGGEERRETDYSKRGRRDEEEGWESWEGEKRREGEKCTALFSL